MARLLLNSLSGSSVLDPCVGEAVFARALVRNAPNQKFDFTLMDIDDRMTGIAQDWASKNGIKAKVVTADYLSIRMDNNFDGVILNPPFVRQEWIKMKESYRSKFQEWYDITIPGTSNLYAYFVVKAIRDVRPGGIITFIVYDSWRSTLFGRWLAEDMQLNCSNLDVDAVTAPFEGRLINATIVAARKADSERDVPSALPTESQSYQSISKLLRLPHFVPLSRVFSTRRGLRLKQASFFLTTRADVDSIGATPFLKKIGRVRGFVVPDDHNEAALLTVQPGLDPMVYAVLERRLKEALKEPTANRSILTWYKERPEAWYLHRKPPYAPILFNYYIRHRPRHLFNGRFFYSDNFYGLTPLRSGLSVLAHLAILNSTVVCAEILDSSSDQGSGLSKIQLYDYRLVHVPDPGVPTPADIRRFDELGRSLVNAAPSLSVIDKIDALVREVYCSSGSSARAIEDLISSISPMRLLPRG